MSSNVASFDNVKLKSAVKKSGYDIWAARVDIGAMVTGAVVVAVCILDSVRKKDNVTSFE